jgi:BMFP domain-containing protein YqiC
MVLRRRARRIAELERRVSELEAALRALPFLAHALDHNKAP